VDTAALFEKTRDLLGSLYNVVSQRHLSAANSPHLSDDDGVVESYSRLLFEVTELHNKLNTMTWLVREIEADHDEVMPGSFSSAEELLASMGV
jgi:hypothetical protein